MKEFIQTLPMILMIGVAVFVLEVIVITIALF